MRYQLAAVTGLAMCVSPATAAQLNIQLEDTPDVVAGNIDVQYTSGSLMLTANGLALELDDDGSVPAEAIVNGTFTIDATIDNMGNLLGGTITIGGTVPTLGYNSGTLISGTLADFGFVDGGGDPFEFTFDATGGDLAGFYAGVQGGVIMGGTGFTGDWSSDFNNNFGFPGFGTATADTAPLIPAPATIMAVLAGGIATTTRRRR